MIRIVLPRYERGHGSADGRSGGPTVETWAFGATLRRLAGMRARLVAGVSAVAVATMLASSPVAAKAKSTKPAVSAPVATTVAKPASADQHMVVEADQVVYDNDNDIVTALGNVQIYYGGNTLTARKVVYQRKTKKVIAEGDARLVDKDGNVLTSPRLDVTEGFADGFVQSLRIETIDRSRFAAESATRSGGDVTVFEKGVYSACQTCVNEPEKPPFWQIKAVKIIHKQQEKTVYYEDAHLEMLGVPIAWLPYFQHPDPSVTRRTGLLMLHVLDSDKLGIGAQVPLYWAPVDDWDATLQPVALSRQGMLMDVEVRHRLDSGTVTARALGIRQADPGAFQNTSGDREYRGALISTGRFTINDHWKWGWDAIAVSDRRFLNDYRITPDTSDRSISTVFISGQGLRNYFDARLYYFTVLDDDLAYDKNSNKLLFGAGTELQKKQAVVHPVVDYDVIGEHPVLGGEISGHFNLTSLSRSQTDIDTYGRIRGIAGTFSRVSSMVGWRREVIDDFGEVFTPFASLRGDVFFDHVTDSSSELGDMGRSGTFARFTPTIGLNWAYPFIAQSTFGAHTFSPIAQIVARPSENWMGRLPNEDAQSVVFDDTTLFRPDKFSGWDRAEGGTRVNLGAEYTFHAPNGGSLSALVGRSYLIAGENSYAFPDHATLINMASANGWVPLTAFGSGLENNKSDWVARVNLDSAAGFRVGAQTRFDSVDFALNRADVQAVGTAGLVTAGVGWSYQKTPKELYDLLSAYGTAEAMAIHDALKDARSELQTHASLRLATNWRFFGGMRYDMMNRTISGDTLGVGYDNDSFSLSLSYSESTYTKYNIDTSSVNSVHDQTIYLRFGLRTLGDGQLSNTLATTPVAN